MALLVPIFLASSIRPFSDVQTCEAGPTEEIYAVARVLWREARNQPIYGQRMMVQVIKNRAVKHNETILETVKRGMASNGRLDPVIVKLVEEEIYKDVGCNYNYWINPELATDSDWKAYSKKQFGIKIGDHFFF